MMLDNLKPMERVTDMPVRGSMKKRSKRIEPTIKPLRIRLRTTHR